MTLSRIMELEEGSIEIDGVDVSKVGLNRLRSCVTVIPQEPSLFKGTLRFNIDPLNMHSDS
jgi:ATP-binding cassette subfamily C (CFTR/MRP) protein 1